MSWFRDSREVICQCGHARCYHERGRQRCHEMHALTETAWTTCSCQIFIADPSKTETDTELQKLKKLAGLK